MDRPFSFMPAVATPSDHIHMLVRILFSQAHRQTDDVFSVHWIFKRFSSLDRALVHWIV
jgi:hypothetical protein